MHTLIKICGITRREDAEVCVDAGADAIGLVFYSKSSRYVNLKQAKAIIRDLPSSLLIVSLVVDPDPLEVEIIIDTINPHLLQFHGQETSAFCESFQRPYIKAISMAKNFLEWDKSQAKALLFDSASGGSGQTFPWHLIQPRPQKPIILAGGLTPDNVSDAIQQVKPYAVDVSSGVEKEPGIKDKDKIKAFVEAIRKGDNA